MAGTQTTASLNGVSTRGNLGAVSLHPVDDSINQGVAAPASLARKNGWISDVIPFNLTPTVSDPSSMNVPSVQG